MKRRVDLSNLDLDRAAGIIAERRAGWQGLGFTLRAPTWVDNDADWPAPLVTDRSQARRPMSVGVRVSREGPYAEAEFVLYAGGWADVDYVARSTTRWSASTSSWTTSSSSAASWTAWLPG